MIFGDFIKAINQLSDPRFRSVFFRGIGLTLALLVGVYAIVLMVVQQIAGAEFITSLFGEVTWVGSLLGWTSILLMMFLSIFLMVPVASAITSLFLDEVANAVEDHHYPHLPPAERIGFYEGLKDTVNFLGVLIAANLVALILYLFLPFGAPLIFLALNGFLLGREYFQIAAMRRLGREGAREMRSRHMPEIWIAGALMAAPLTVPIINLLVPILGAATFTHLFHRLMAAEQRVGY